jgi:5-carboxymethyl-2-hydroxymuconate isomerase
MFEIFTTKNKVLILFKTEVADTLHEDIYIHMCVCVGGGGVFMMETYCNPYKVQTDA